MVNTTFSIASPADFDFRRTVFSHGWYSLLPFALNQGKWILTRVFALETGAPVAVEIREAQNSLEIVVNQQIDNAARAEIERQVRHVLQLDEDFTEFYRIVAGEPDFAWIAEHRAGRLLRSPTVFEDLVKSICTTNCSWALTKIMTANLVQKLGEPTIDVSHKNFPTAAAMAAQSVEFYKTEIRAGYRSTYLKELADKIAGGYLNVESWLDSDVPTDSLKKEIKLVKGAGDYAAENLLKLLGRYDGLALDSFLRMRFAQIRNDGVKCGDQKIREFYQRFGLWRGLALWCDATKDWL